MQSLLIDTRTAWYTRREEEAGFPQAINLTTGDWYNNGRLRKQLTETVTIKIHQSQPTIVNSTYGDA